jgi:hypothetical protein
MFAPKIPKKNSLWVDVKLLNVCNVGTKGNHKAENSYKTDIPDTS